MDTTKTATTGTDMPYKTASTADMPGKVEKTNKPTHRYVCEACTNNAGTSNNPESMKAISCQSCGKYQECKTENWIKL